ncbi:hypothetical protein [Nonomuraea sp. NEAU-A123]|uniref:hypothetical protein n=1 Tax=Nonomuraea sp. NEAU-A123 TaxID=2839649 RepID=UPI001BE45146|nr:hypothetical protein [Nonomuraea sp. NEAU-A123]MBT2226277.1 hypothetical protein [Nonomuraea sp. NEAU-A123]
MAIIEGDRTEYGVRFTNHHGKTIDIPQRTRALALDGVYQAYEMQVAKGDVPDAKLIYREPRGEWQAVYRHETFTARSVTFLCDCDVAVTVRGVVTEEDARRFLERIGRHKH